VTTRRTIRIEVTDTEDSETDRFGCSNQERATLVREFAMTMGHDLSPAQVVEAIGAWLDRPSPPQSEQVCKPGHCNFLLVDYRPPRLCVLPPGHKGEHYGIGGDS